MRDAYSDLIEILEGLTDDEFFCGAGARCWTIYQDESGRWTYQYEEPDPVPPPLTNIGWKLVHVAALQGHLSRVGVRFRPGRLHQHREPLRCSICGGDAREGSRLLARDIRDASDTELDRLVLTNWGERWPALKIFRR